MPWLLAVVALLVGCAQRVETRTTEEPLVLDDGAWLPTDAERSLLLGTHRLAPGVRPEAAQVYRWLAMVLLEEDGSFLALERATFFNGDDLDADPGYRNRRGTYALRQRTDGTRALVLDFARKNDDAEASRTDVGSVTYVARLDDQTMRLAYDQSAPARDDAFLPMTEDRFGACAVTRDCTAQHAGERSRWTCAVPTDRLGPSFGTCEPHGDTTERVVPSPGIEPGTRGFSIPCSTN